MKHFIRIIIFAMLLLLTGTPLAVSAETADIEKSGYSTDPVAEEKAESIIKGFYFKFLTTEPEKEAIDCFSVNKKGEFAIGRYNKNTVCVYANDGNYLYGYSFQCDGSFGIELKEEILYIYIDRGDLAIALDTTGQVKSVQIIQNTPENNSYDIDYVDALSKKVGNIEYKLQNEKGIILASSFSQLVAISPDGEERILYDVSAEYTPKIIIGFVIFVLFVALVVFFIIKTFKNNKEEYYEQKYRS